MIYMTKPVRYVYRVCVIQDDVLAFNNKRYVGIDRCFTSRKAAITFYRNLIKHSDFSDKIPIYSTVCDGDLSVGFFSDYSITSFRLTSKTL